jgi:hypothetical protein
VVPSPAMRSNLRPRHAVMSSVRRVVTYAWAAPNTSAGLFLGLIAIALGACAKVERGTLEISGGLLGRVAARLPKPCNFSALTLGHVILGVTPSALSTLRHHERVHVAQYERWGPLFIPAYVLAGLWQGLRGRSVYAANVFERHAQDAASLAAESVEPTPGGCPSPQMALGDRLRSRVHDLSTYRRSR